MIFVAATVNGRPAMLKVDTGATASVFAAKFQTVQRGTEIQARTAGGAVKGIRTDAHLELGDLRFQLTAVYLRDFIDQGVIGIDVLGQFARVVIDFQAKEIEFVPFGQVEANATH